MAYRASLAAVFLALILSFSTAHAQTAQERLWEAAIAGDTTSIVAAIEAGADVDSLDTRRSRNGRRALNWAALNDRVPALRVLLAHGATLEARNRTGFTALHHAAEAGAADALRLLLAVGADPRAANAAGVSPAQTARRLGHIGVAVLLETAPAGR
jgi:ankyrin repeat protein